MRHLKLYESFRRINENNSDLVDQILQLDEELENTPIYKEYERSYISEMYEPQINQQIELMAKMMGSDLSGASSEDMDELREKMLDMIIMQGKEAAKNITKEQKIKMMKEGKQRIIGMVNKVLKLAERDEEYRLCSKLKKYIDLLNHF